MQNTQQIKGAALIMVLGVVAVVSAVALVSVEGTSRLIRTTSHAQSHAQAREYARSATRIAEHRARDLALQAVDYTQSHIIAVPIPEGTVQTRLTDASNCFNLARLVKRDKSGRTRADPIAIRLFADYLQQFDIGANVAFAIARAATDWQDSDDAPLSGGAETAHYQRRDPPHRAANRPMVSVKELRLIPEVTASMMAAIGAGLCVDGAKNTVPLVLNVNALTAHHAPLVVVALEGAITQAEAHALIVARPPRGYSQIAYFWAEQILRDKAISARAKARFRVRATRLRLVVDAEYAGVRARLVSRLHFDRNGTRRIIDRQYEL